MVRGSTSLASAATTCGPAPPNPSRASTWPSVSEGLNGLSTASSAPWPSASSSGGGANGIWMSGRGGAARPVPGSGGGAKGIRNIGGAAAPGAAGLDVAILVGAAGGAAGFDAATLVGAAGGAAGFDAATFVGAGGAGRSAFLGSLEATSWRAARTSAARASLRRASSVFEVDWRFRTSRGAVPRLKKKT